MIMHFGPINDEVVQGVRTLPAVTVIGTRAVLREVLSRRLSTEHGPAGPVP